MNKIKSDNINFDNDNFIINIDINDALQEEPAVEQREDEEIQRRNLILNRAKEEAQNIINEAQEKINNTISSSNKKAQEIIDEAKIEAQKIIEDAKKEALNIEENSKKEAQELLLNSEDELEKIRIQATKDGYEDGHKEGLEKIQEEMEEKVEAFSKFCFENTEIKNKVLKSASRDILEIITNISKKILYKELNASILDKIIKETVSKLEKKENVTIIVSEKYAKLLFELQKKSLGDDIEFKFEDFKQYDNFNLIYNPKYSDDTIIVENFKERFDASIKAQLDAIIRDIYEKTKNGQLDLEQYIEDKNETC